MFPLLRMLVLRGYCLRHVQNAGSLRDYHIQRRRLLLNKVSTTAACNVDSNTSNASLHTQPPLARRPETKTQDTTQAIANPQLQTNTKHQRNQHLPAVGIKQSALPTLSSFPQQNPESPQPTEESPVKMPYNIDWIFTTMSQPSKLWLAGSQLVITIVGLFSKFVLFFMNRTRVYNLDRLEKAVAKRPPGLPLVTVSNHHSCFDDPGMWGVLPVRYVCNTFTIRWSMAAHDICFTNKLHSTFFMLGKCIPVVRGLGVYQNAIDLCIQKCARGQWVHVFPEGKVNMTKEEMRLKWGVGRIIYESPRIPIILPMWHEGMDDVLPNVEPYIIKWRKKVTFNIGEPLDLHDFIKDLKDRKVPEPEARKLITDKIEAAFRVIRKETEQLHKERCS